jgi:glycosyltransferase involved in cell wall biosynthesis
VEGGKPPLRVVNAMFSRGFGGLEQALLDYGDALHRSGHDVHALIHPEAAVRKALDERGAVWHGLQQYGAWDLLAVMRLRALLRRLRPDICIAHGNRAMSLLRWTGAQPLIAVLPNYKMKCHGAAAVLYSTDDLRRYARAQGVADSRLHHVPNMVRVPPSPPIRCPRQTPVIGAMGRFVAKKGFETLIRALGRLKSQGVCFQAILAGDGPQRVTLERLAGDCGLRDTMWFPGWVHDKPAFFAGIDVFCLPSLHEPFGIVLLEAMAQALPIIATDSEGPSEILRDGKDAIIVPRGDTERLAEALTEMIADPDRAAWLAANAYRQAQDAYDLPRVSARLDLAVRRVVLEARSGATEAADATA